MKFIDNMKYTVMSLLAVFIIGGLWTSCEDDVAMPRSFITLSTDTIQAPSIASTFDFEVQANCDWQIELSDETSGWAHLSSRENTGSSTVTIELAANQGSTPRKAELTVSNTSKTAVSTLVLVQNPGTAEGYLTVADIKTLAASGSYSFKDASRLRAVVVSDQRFANFPENRLAVISSLDPGNGLVVATDKEMILSAGDEIEIELEGASAGTSATTGLFELKPASDAGISRTPSTSSTPKPIPVTIADIATGKYDGMFVTVNCQVHFNDLQNKTISPSVTVQEAEGAQMKMYVLPSSQLSSAPVPSGSGTASGIALKYKGEYCLLPRSASDIDMAGQRFDGGITLPYIFSFMTEGANQKGRYSTYVSDAEVNNCRLVTNDGTGTTFQLNLNSASKYFNFWTDTSGHHNIPMGTWGGGQANYIVYMFPLGQDMPDSFRITFGLGSQRNGPAHWEVLYSADTQTWYPVTDDEWTVSLPIGSGNQYEFGSGKNFFNYQIDVKDTKVKFKRKDNLYIMFRPHDTVSISGGKTTGSYGRSTMHCCVALEDIPSFSTSKPTGAVYFEAFDSNTQGLDFRYGDRICAMLNYCGDDIAKWKTSNGLTGTNVRQRPGYAQIGYVESEYTPHTAYVNEVGTLTTPALGAAGTLKLSFKAMAYRNWASFDVSSNAAPDRKGDLTSATIEVLGGGTIDGQTKVKFAGMTYSEFSDYTFVIEGATADTRLRFSSDVQPGQFSRWFIDDICVTR